MKPKSPVSTCVASTTMINQLLEKTPECDKFKRPRVPMPCKRAGILRRFVRINRFNYVKNVNKKEERGNVRG